MQKILYIEDDYNLLKETTVFLRNNGYESYGTWGGYEGLKLYEELSPDLILLDLDMPDIHGFDIMRKLRAKDIRVRLIVISEHADAFNQLLSFQLLADDCIQKPFEFPILNLRIDNALAHKRIDCKSPYYEIEDFKIDYIQRSVIINNTFIVLTAFEFDILALLTKKAGTVVRYKKLVNRAFGDTYISNITVLRVEIQRIRGKIEKDPKNPKFIKTFHGVGYGFMKE